MIPGWGWIGPGALADPAGRLIAVAGNDDDRYGAPFVVDVDRDMVDLWRWPNRIDRQLVERYNVAAGPFVVGSWAFDSDRTGWRVLALHGHHLLDARGVRVDVHRVDLVDRTVSVRLIDVTGTWRMLDG